MHRGCRIVGNGNAHVLGAFLLRSGCTAQRGRIPAEWFVAARSFLRS